MKVYVHFEEEIPFTMALAGTDVASMTCQQVLQVWNLVN